MTLQATHITRITPPKGRVCGRCGRSLEKPRPGRALCEDCGSIELLEGAAERAQVALDEMGDDELLALIEMPTRKRAAWFRARRRRMTS